jgi:Mor family transcriptional regulator
MIVPDVQPPAPASDPRAYANAREILPVQILQVVQTHFDGGLLWVPPREARRDKTKGHLERNRQILQEKADGASTKDLAQKYGLSEERIRQLVRGPKSADSSP